MMWLDRYDRTARLAPGLLALIPVAFTLLALGLKKIPVIAVAGSLVSAAGGPMLLARLARAAGLKAQDQLWKAWGGAPTTIALRLRATAPNAVLRTSWREAVENLTGHRLLTSRAEEKDPAKADQTIEAAIAEVREMTRTNELVIAENRNYGFARNFYGLRWLGRGVAALGVAAIAALLLFGGTGGRHAIPTEGAVAGLVVDGVVLMIWIFVPTAKGVRTVADRYAYQLLNAAVNLSKSPPTASATTDAG